MSLVSVVIPAFNAAEWVVLTLRSVLAQTYGDVEVILVDDGSIDRTREIAEEVFAEGRFPFQILHQSNQGVSAARNRGWRAARGEWIQFLDADDLLHPEKITLQVTRILENEVADVVYSDWQKLTFSFGSWRPEQIRRPLIGRYALADLLRDENFMQLGSQIFSVKILDKVGGFDEAHTLVEDVELCIKIASVDGVFAKVNTSHPVSWYRDRPRSLSKLDQRQFVEACVRNAELVEQNIRLSGNSETCMTDAVIDVYYGAARYFADHDWRRFEQIVAKIEKFQPEFLPKAPSRLRMLSRITGYRKAEQFASVYRKSKNRSLYFWRERSHKSDRSG